MERKYFLLEGSSGIGKSTFIRKIILNSKRNFIGFNVIRYIDSADKKTLGHGFNLYNSKVKRYYLLEKKVDDISEYNDIFINPNKTPIVNIDVINRFSKYLEELFLDTQQDDIILFDEIGGVELFSDSFSKIIYNLLIERPNKIIGVFKKKDNRKNMTIKASNESWRLEQENFIKRVFENGFNTILINNQDDFKKSKKDIEIFLK